ncbi:MAG: DUF1214 domain-containing protein [Halioglobus sp.]|nr:DUF1214 domain-containing protein [Halioglobus sp.]
MRTRYAAATVILAAMLPACGGGSDDKPEPLGVLDFRPTSEFGFDAVITGLQLGKEIVDEHAGDNDRARAEGYRYLLRQIEMNLANMTADADPAHPLISRCPSRNCKLGFDNPDYTYTGASPLSAAYNYRLYGSRGTSHFVLFQVLERADGPFKGTSKTDTEMMQFAADGSWEIYLGAEKPAGVPQGNFLQLTADQATLVIRIAHYDWERTIEPSVAIEVLDPVASSAEQFTPMRMATAGFALSKMLPGQLRRWTKRLADAPLNAVEQPCVSWGNYCGAEGGSGIWATGGRYRLAQDEALIVSAPAMELVYQNIQLGNMWAESLDYATRQTSLNGHQAHRDSDGVYRYVLAHSDPGVPNWLDVSGQPEGSLFMRWIRTVDNTVPGTPASKVVKLSEVRRHLPADTPVVTAAQRTATLQRRYTAVNRRMNPAGVAAVESAP